MGSILLPARTSSLRRDSDSNAVPPPLPPRRNSIALQPLHLKTVTTLSGGMDSRYYRPSSPRGRVVNPARSSTGTFADPYYDSSYYTGSSSPRSSADRVSGSHHQPYSTYTPSTSTASRTANLKYDSYNGRPRRNTLNESDDRLVRPNVSSLAPPTSLPLRTHHDRPSSPLARSWDSRGGDTYITHGSAPRREHKRIYSVDDNSHSAKLVSEKDVVEPRRREGGDYRGHGVTSGGRTYHQNKPVVRNNELPDEGYSYTDPASMYRDTEPAWRRPRSGSVERGSRPTSMILDRGPRTSNRELGPPPSTRGFEKINNGVGKNSNFRDHHARSSSIERSRDIPKYDPYPDTAPTRSSSSRHHAPAVHQEPREHRRDTYHDDYDRRDREPENRRYPADRFEDRDVASRGFGIASSAPSHASEHHTLDRQPVWNAPEPSRARHDDYGSQYYSSDRADVRMPEPRSSRDRDIGSSYEERPRERESRRDGNNIAPAAAGAVAGAAGAAVAYGANEKTKGRDKERGGDRDRERDRDRDREREMDRERERRREWDEHDRRDRVPDERRDRKLDDRREERRDRGDERRDRAIEDRAPPASFHPAENRRERITDERRDDRRDRGYEERRDRVPEDHAQPSGLGPAAAAYASAQEADRKPRERRYEEDTREKRPPKVPSSEGSGDERPRHYVDSSSERRQDSAPAESTLDPDEEYRRRIQQEAERSGRSTRDFDASDSDREKERRRRKEERDRSRDARGSSNAAEPAHSRYDNRSPSFLDTDIVQEPDPVSSAGAEQPSKSVQIVSPPKEPQPQPKGILRKPTEKFPEEPDPIREGVAPHKSVLKGKDIPVGARWTRIDRKLVNPEALEEAKERFEERMDCVIVLRVLTKQDIQKLADRTREIREAREDEYERGDRRDRDRRSHRSHRDDEDRDRDRRRDHDDTDDEDDGRERGRGSESGRPGQDNITQCVTHNIKNRKKHRENNGNSNKGVSKRSINDEKFQRNECDEDKCESKHRHRETGTDQRRKLLNDRLGDAKDKRSQGGCDSAEYDKFEKKSKSRLGRVLEWFE